MIDDRTSFDLELSLNDGSSIDEYKKELPENLLQLFSYLTQKAYLSERDREFKTLIFFGKLSIVKCSEKTKKLIARKLWIQYPASDEVRRFFQSTLRPLDLSRVPSSEKQLSEIEELTQSLPHGFVKRRLKQVIDEYRWEDRNQLERKYEDYLNRIDKLGTDSIETILSLSEYTEKSKTLSIGRLKSIFSLATLACYDSFDTTGKQIVVQGEVASDGLGDYFQMWLSAGQLQEALPKASVILITPPMANSTPAVSASLRTLLRHWVNSPTHRKEVEKIRHKSNCVINIPYGYTPIPRGVPSILVKEYGFKSGGHLYMGVPGSPTTTWNLGIPLPTTSSACSLDALSHIALRERLKESERPFFVGYLDFAKFWTGGMRQ